MNKVFSLLAFFLFVYVLGIGQTNHWEMIINSTDDWKYQVGVAQPDYNWATIEYNAEGWETGPGGVGYGNPDCSTIIPEGSVSVYVRREFEIEDAGLITLGQLNIMFDDGFIAYLNGVEIARSNLEGNPPDWDQFSVDYQEEEELIHPFSIDSVLLSSLLVNGENVLAVEVHNQSDDSSDLSCSPYLFFGFSDTELHFVTPPEWFIPLGGNGGNSTPPTSYDLESNLPIIVVNSMGQNIVDEPKVTAFMGIIHNESGSNSTQQAFNHFDGNIGIELRGSSSLYFPKKSYGLELWTASGADTSISIFDMPEEEDWILQGPYTDKSLLRNVLAYHMSNAMGMWAPHTQLVELIVNDEYLGVYAFMEKIKRDAGRVDIAKLKPEDNSGEELTGGYILKIDKPRSDPGFDSEYPAMGDYYNPDYPIRFLYDYPKADDITPQQKAYIKSYVHGFEDALASDDFQDPETGYESFIDVDSFIDFMIINEVSKNIDGYRISTFFYKDKNGKIKMGPVWDFNFAFGMQKWYNSFSPEGWNFKMYEYWTWEDYQFPFWWERLLEDHQYRIKLAERWEYLREDILSDESLSMFITDQCEILADAQERNFSKWPIIGVDVDPNYYTFNSYEEETDYLNDWLLDRMAWLDLNIGGFANIVHGNTSLDNVRIYPNPFTDGFSISLNLEQTSTLSVSVTNTLNIPCGKFHKQNCAAGEFTIHWKDFTSTMGSLPPGLYLVELVVNDVRTSYRMLKI